MAIKNTTVSQQYPHFRTITFPTKTYAALTVGSSGLTLTADQLLGGLLPINCTDAGALTLPTAAQIIAALPPGYGVGTAFDVDIINYGDSTATITVGTGITNVVIDSEDAVLALATHEAIRLTLVVTGIEVVTTPGTVNSINLYGHGVNVATS
jgi:hypothetical protein